MFGEDPMALSEIAIILVVLSVASFIKGVTGAGLMLLTIPVLAVFIGIERAVVIMAIPNGITNGWLVWHHRRHLRETRDLRALVIAGCVGAVLGAIGLQRLDSVVLGLILAVVIVIYVTLFLSPFEIRMSERASKVVSPPVGLLAGFIHSSTGMSGPILTPYMHSFRLKPQVFVVSLVSVFLLYSVVQIASFVQLGLYTPQRFVESFVAVIPMMVVIPIGARFADRINPRVFDWCILGLLILSASKLIFDVIVAVS